MPRTPSTPSPTSNPRRPSTYLLAFIGAVLWCIAAGKFFEERLPFGDNPLYWALVISVAINIWLFGLVIDYLWEKWRRSP